ncbi:11354_t:CDS:1, partial [Gigaspora margarita]
IQQLRDFIENNKIIVILMEIFSNLETKEIQVNFESYMNAIQKLFFGATSFNKLYNNCETTRYFIEINIFLPNPGTKENKLLF